MKEFHNCFIGIPLDNKFKDEAKAIQKFMQKQMPSGSIVEPHNMHLTLYYLGKQSESDLEEIANILHEERNEIYNQEIQVVKSGVFEKNLSEQSEPYVIYLKIIPGDELLAYRKKLGSLLSDFNIDDTREFVPHITLARLKTPDARKQYLVNKDSINKSLSKINWLFRLTEIIIYGKINLDSSKFQDSLYKIPLV